MTAAIAARYREGQLAAGKCMTGCGEPRWGTRVTCKACTFKRAAWRRTYYRAQQKA